MPSIAKKHLAEWKSSQVSNEIILANVTSVEGKAADSKVLGNQKASPKFREQFHGGGWWVDGLEPKDWAKRMRWGQLKLDDPRVKDDGSILKYESPIGQSTRATFLEIPSKPDFWPDVANNIQIPLYITEGAKKAGCLLTLGFACVAIPGIWNSAKKDDKGNRQVIRELKPFLGKGRPIIYVYDADDQPRKRRNVYNAIKKSGRAFQDYGCDVSWVTWDSDDGKGIDDLCANLGPDHVASVIASPYRLKTHEEQIHNVCKYAIDTHVFEYFFGGRYTDYISINSAIYRWDSQKGFWKKQDPDNLKRKIAEFLSACYQEKKAKDGEDPIRHYRFGSNNNLKSCYQFCISRLNVEVPERSRMLRTFRNGTLDCETKEFRSWDKYDYLTWRLESDYVPNQDLPSVTKNFISSSYGEDLIPLIRAVTSMLLDPSAPWEHFPYLVGRSGGGKGTLIALWQSMFNTEAISSSTNLSMLQHEDKRHTYLHGKALFTAPDVLGYQTKLDSFYELVSNGLMSARRLFNSEGYETHFNTRFIVASVEPLQTEGSQGWDRRAIVIPLKNSKCVKDPKLKIKLRAEVSQFISWALAMPTDERNHMLYNWRNSSDRLQNTAYAMEVAGDPMRAFIDNCLRPDFSGPGMSATAIHELYLAYAEATGKKGNISISRVGSKLKAMIPDFYEERRRFRKEEANPQNLKMKPSTFNVTVLPDVFMERLNSNGQKIWYVNKAKLDEGGLLEFDTFQFNEKSEPEESQENQPTLLESNDSPDTTDAIEPEPSQLPNPKDNSSFSDTPFRLNQRIRDRLDASRLGQITSIDSDKCAPIRVTWDDGGSGCYNVGDLELVPNIVAQPMNS